VLPKTVLEVEWVYTVNALYNFELSPGASSVVINGVGVITLGQAGDRVRTYLRCPIRLEMEK
jgi:hypothetical protein